MEQTAFVIHREDNVATALSELAAGEIRLTGETAFPTLRVTENVPSGHKMALSNMVWS